MENPICCAPRVDRFLTDGRSQSWGPERSEKIVVMQQVHEYNMQGCLIRPKKNEWDL